MDSVKEKSDFDATIILVLQANSFLIIFKDVLHRMGLRWLTSGGAVNEILLWDMCSVYLEKCPY